MIFLPTCISVAVEFAHLYFSFVSQLRCTEFAPEAPPQDGLVPLIPTSVSSLSACISDLQLTATLISDALSFSIAHSRHSDVVELMFGCPASTKMVAGDRAMCPLRPDGTQYSIRTYPSPRGYSVKTSWMFDTLHRLHDYVASWRDLRRVRSSSPRFAEGCS